MPQPSFSVINGQVPTSLRIYDYFDKKVRYRSECREEFEGCRFKLLTPQDRFLPFQFARPFSVAGIVSWKVYDLGDNEVLDLSAEADDLLTIDHVGGRDFVTYNGGALLQTLPEGYLYFVIEVEDRSFYSEDFFVSCIRETGQLPDMSVGLYSDVNTSSPYIVDAPQILAAVILVAGAPTNPALAIEGNNVANTGDDSLWTYAGAVWTQDPTPPAGAWYNLGDGNWYQFTGGNWVGMVDQVVMDGSGLSWPGGVIIPITVDLSGVSCIGSDALVEFSATGTTGTVEVDVEGTSETITISGSESFTVEVADGDTLTITPASGFDGELTSLQVSCLQGLDSCHMSLSWSNCGAVGNIHYGELTNVFYLPQDTIKPRASTELKIDVDEDEDGEQHEVSRRRETNWTVFIGVVPWYVVDALSAMCLHDTVHLNYPNGGESETLLHPRVIATPDDTFSKCLVPVTLAFQIENDTVNCCDSFDAPCLESCADVNGLDTDHMDEGGVYLLTGVPAYATYDGAELGANTTCDSGLANVVDEEDEIIYTAIWDINAQAWVPIAENADAVVDGDCGVVLTFDVFTGYTGILQYVDDNEEWVDDPEWELSATEWAENELTRTAPDDQDAGNTLRLRVVCPDGTTVGYSESFTYACP